LWFFCDVEFIVAWPLSLLSTELSVHDLQALAPFHAEARTLAMAACLNEFDDSSGKAYDCKAEEVEHIPQVVMDGECSDGYSQ
jgi:hypothetical protein